MLWLVLAGALASVISLGYYLRLVWAMFIKPPGEALDVPTPALRDRVRITSLADVPGADDLHPAAAGNAAARAAGG
jgi:NADH:ubiquinone oxidoreductase subunit 2 (subunit N)